MFIQLKSKRQRLLEFLRDSFIEFVESSCFVIGIASFLLIQGPVTGQKMLDLILKDHISAISVILVVAIFLIGALLGRFYFWILKKTALFLYKGYKKIFKRKLPY